MTPASPLPHAETIQRLFGRHDTSGIQAHTGPGAAEAARAIGAQAYATGNHVVLGNGTDLHTVAHEAAHVIQQRRGVQLKGGVGEAGDRYERHADMVADLVVRGASAEATLDELAGTGDHTPAPGVQRVDAKEHEQLLLDDQREIRAGQEEMGFTAVRNAIGNMLPEHANTVLASFTEDKRHWPIDFRRVLQECRQTKGKADKCTQIINKAVSDAQELIQTLAKQLAAFEVKPEVLGTQLLPEFGYARVSAAAAVYVETDRSVPFLEFVRQHTLSQVPQVDLGSLKPQEIPKYQQVPPSKAVVDSAERTRTSGAPMSPNGYIERHFSRSTMEFLLGHPEVEIVILEGTVDHLLAHAKAAGFTHLHRLEDNPQTDFVKYTARNSQTGETCVLVLAPSGESYRRELLAHFTHYQDPKGQQRTINDKRIKLLRLAPEQAEREFDQALTELALPQIDVLVLGKVDDFGNQLKERGVNPVKLVRCTTPPLYGKVYAINQRCVLSLAIEPGLYAGRAGEFLRVLLARQKSVAMIFAGTTGGLDPNLQVQDIVAPTVFSQVDELDPSLTIKDQHNHAVDVLGQVEKVNERFPSPSSEPRAPGVFFGNGITHGAVDSILLEDNPWFAKFRKQITVVEQEVAGLLGAVQKEPQRLKAYVFLTISDVLGRDTFDHAETHQASQPKHKMGVLMMTALERELGEIQSATTIGLEPTALKLELSTDIPRTRLTKAESRIKDISTGLPKLTQTLTRMKEAQDKNFNEGRQKQIAGIEEQLQGLNEELKELTLVVARLRLVLEARDQFLQDFGPLLARLAQLHPKQAIALEANLKDVIVDSAFRATSPKSQPSSSSSSSQSLPPVSLNGIMAEVMTAVVNMLQRHGTLVSQLALPELNK